MDDKEIKLLQCCGRISRLALEEYPRVPTQLIGWKRYQAKLPNVRNIQAALAMVKIMLALALGACHICQSCW